MEQAKAYNTSQSVYKFIGIELSKKMCLLSGVTSHNRSAATSVDRTTKGIVCKSPSLLAEAERDDPIFRLFWRIKSYTNNHQMARTYIDFFFLDYFFQRLTVLFVPLHATLYMIGNILSYQITCSLEFLLLWG